MHVYCAHRLKPNVGNATYVVSSCAILQYYIMQSYIYCNIMQFSSSSPQQHQNNVAKTEHVWRTKLSELRRFPCMLRDMF